MNGERQKFAQDSSLHIRIYEIIRELTRCKNGWKANVATLYWQVYALSPEDFPADIRGDFTELQRLIYACQRVGANDYRLFSSPKASDRERISDSALKLYAYMITIRATVGEPALP